MFFTLAVSADTAARCVVLTDAALGTDPRVMPVRGPARVADRRDRRQAPIRPRSSS